MAMETTQIFILFFQGLLTITLAMGGFIVKGIMKRLDYLENDMKGMKDNYLDRFKEVIANQTEAKEILTKSQTDLKEELVKQHQESKDKLMEAINKLNLALIERTVIRKKIKR